jgi:hypothetical protein
MVHLATKPLPYLADLLKEPAGARINCGSAEQTRSGLVFKASTARSAAENPMPTTAVQIRIALGSHGVNGPLSSTKTDVNKVRQV